RGARLPDPRPARRPDPRRQPRVARRLGLGSEPMALKDIFSFLFQRSAGEERVAQYVIREHDRGRALSEILEDRYVVNRLQSPEQRARLLDRPEIIQAVGGDMAEAAKASISSAASKRSSRTYGMPSAAGAPRRRRAVPVETSTSTRIVITYGSAWKSCGAIVTPRAWRISGSAESPPKT